MSRQEKIISKVTLLVTLSFASTLPLALGQAGAPRYEDRDSGRFAFPKPYSESDPADSKAIKNDRSLINGLLLIFAAVFVGLILCLVVSHFCSKWLLKREHVKIQEL